MRINRPTQLRGYALLMTLLLLALVTAATAGVARLCLRQSMAAAQAEGELQRRWGVLSIRSTLLPDAVDLLAKANAPTIETSIPLGVQRFDLLLSDEQAKVNVNALLERSERRDVEQVVTQLARTNGSPVEVELPDFASGGTSKAPEVVGFAQVFPRAMPGELLEHGVISDLTCWGDGKLNYQDASRSAMRAACAGFLDFQAIEKLLAARLKNPPQKLAEALNGANLSDAQLQAANLLLTEKSQCQSLWVVDRDGQRSWYQLFVKDSSTGGSETDFEW